MCPNRSHHNCRKSAAVSHNPPYPLLALHDARPSRSLEVVASTDRAVEATGAWWSRAVRFRLGSRDYLNRSCLSFARRVPCSCGAASSCRVLGNSLAPAPQNGLRNLGPRFCGRTGTRNLGSNRAGISGRHNPRLTFRLPGMEIDFGGIGKEYAADRAASVCKAMGIRHGLVDLSGDIRLIGPRPDGDPWRIGVRRAAP